MARKGRSLKTKDCRLLRWVAWLLGETTNVKTTILRADCMVKMTRVSDDSAQICDCWAGESLPLSSDDSRARLADPAAPRPATLSSDHFSHVHRTISPIKAFSRSRNIFFRYTLQHTGCLQFKMIFSDSPDKFLFILSHSTTPIYNYSAIPIPTT